MAAWEGWTETVLKLLEAGAKTDLQDKVDISDKES